MNRVEICTPLRKFFLYLVACPHLAQPVTLADAQEQLELLPLCRLEHLLGGLKPGQTADEIATDMQQNVALLLAMNPYPALVEDFLAHHFLFHDASRN